MKKLLLSLFIALLFTTNATAETIETNESCQYENPIYCNNPLTRGLDSNQTTLFYMYSNEQGHFFLDPIAEYENVIFIGLDDFYISNPHHGKKYIGTFADATLWELTDIREVN